MTGRGARQPRRSLRAAIVLLALAGGVLAAPLCSAAIAAAERPECATDGGPPPAGAFAAAGGQYRFRFEPGDLAVGQRFAVVVTGCTAGIAPLTKVDARMPAHRHGMNYRPVLTRLDETLWRVDGLLLHMPGAWRFIFTVEGPDGRAEAAVDREVR